MHAIHCAQDDGCCDNQILEHWPNKNLSRRGFVSVFLLFQSVRDVNIVTLLNDCSKL